MNLPPVGPDVRQWAEDVRRVVQRQWSVLSDAGTGSAAQDGLIGWNRAGYSAVTVGGTWAQIPHIVSAPASATAPGTPGTIAFDGSYVYVCTAPDTWRRSALATW